MRIGRELGESLLRKHGVSALIVASLFVLAIFAGWVTVKNFGAGAILTLLIFFTGVLLFVPEAAPAVVLLAAYDFLGFADPTAFGRIPGIFKLRDLLLIATVLVASSQVIIARRERDVLKSGCVRAALAFSVYVVAVIPYTVLTHHSSLNLAFRVSAPYFYYLLMIPVMIFTRNAGKLHILLVVLLVLALVPEAVSVLQIVTQRQISPFAGVVWMDVGGLSLPRSYVLSYNLTGLALLCLFGAYLYVQSARIRLLCALSAVAVSAGVVLTFGRTFWMGTIGAILFLFVVAHVGLERRDIVLKRTIALWGRIGAVAALAVILLLLSGKERSTLGFTGLIGRRFVSTFSDISERSGTFGFRLQESAFRIRLFKQSPLLGVGYVHESSEFAAELPKKTVRTVDSGVITVLAQMGVVGLAAICALIAIFLKRGLYIFKRIRNPLLKGVSLGIVSFYVQAIIMFAGLTGVAFTHQAGICTIGLAVGLQEVLLRIDGESTQV